MAISTQLRSNMEMIHARNKQSSNQNYQGSHIDGNYEQVHQNKIQ